MKFLITIFLIISSCIFFNVEASKAEPIKYIRSFTANAAEHKVRDNDCRYLKNLTQKRITPENTILAFDLHEVLFTRSYGTMVWGGLKLFFKSFFFILFHPLFLWELIKVSFEEMIHEGMYIKLQANHPYIKRWENDIFDIANSCCYPDMFMIELLKALKQKGFKIFLLSNIGADALMDFRKRFDCIETVFDGFYTPSRTNNYSYKPILGFYEGFKKYVNSLGYENKQILFVDDIEKNIIGAAQAGISGIHYTGYEELRETLHKLGICLYEQSCSGYFA